MGEFKERERYLSVEEVIDYLYEIRCDVAHEGKYWEFMFMQEDGDITPSPRFKKGEMVYCYITYNDFCNLIINGAIRAIELYMKNE